MLEKIQYYDYDVRDLTDYRSELAESHDKFFKVIDKINTPENQEVAVEMGVINLFNAKKYDSIISLINAFEKRSFDNRKLKDDCDSSGI